MKISSSVFLSALLLLLSTNNAFANVINLTCREQTIEYNGLEEPCDTSCSTLHLLIDTRTSMIRLGRARVAATITEAEVTFTFVGSQFSLDRYTGQMQSIGILGGGIFSDTYQCQQERRRF
jgi:hypothetical protein